jgi:hypothetical protein
MDEITKTILEHLEKSRLNIEESGEANNEIEKLLLEWSQKDFVEGRKDGRLFETNHLKEAIQKREEILLKEVEVKNNEKLK